MVKFSMYDSVDIYSQSPMYILDADDMYPREPLDDGVGSRP